MADQNEEKSVEYPMPSIVNADQVIDSIFGNNPDQKISKQRIVEAASKASIVPDVMYYFTHLPDQEFTKRELVDQMNRLVKERHREPEVGLFEKGSGAEEAVKPEQKRA